MDTMTADTTVVSETSYRLSPKFGKLVAALLNVQRAAGHISKDSEAEIEGRGYRYPTLAAVLDTVKPLLCDNNVLVLQPTRVEETKVTVTTLLMVEDEFIESSLTLAASHPTPQSVGSAITYARRYGLLSLLCLATEDDDGLAGSNLSLPKTSTPAKAPAKPKVDAKPAPVKEPAKAPEQKQAEVKAAQVEAPAPAAAPEAPAPAAPVVEQPAPTPTPAPAQEPAPAPAAVAPAPAAPEVKLPGAPEGLTPQEVSVIVRLREGVQRGECSIERAKASLSEGGLSFKQLSATALSYARALILQEPSPAALDVGF